MAIFSAVILALLTFGLRILPHPWNVAPTAAAMLFAGAVLPRRWGWIAPLVGSLAADAVIGRDHWQIEAVIYVAFFGMWAAGALCNRLEGRRAPWVAARTVVLSLAGSVLFFATTNWAVWMWSGIYPATWAGLLQSYVMAVPFFLNTLAGDLAFTGAFFGCYAAVLWTVRHRAHLFDRGVLARQRFE